MIYQGKVNTGFVNIAFAKRILPYKLGMTFSEGVSKHLDKRDWKDTVC